MVNDEKILGLALDDVSLERAIEAGKRRRAARLHAVSATYVASGDRVEIQLDGGISLGFPRNSIEELANLSPKVLASLTVSPRGSGLEVDEADVQIDLHGLMASLLTPQAMAQALAKHGRRTTSESQAQAARRNGRKGGRPRKSRDREVVGAT